MATETPKLKLPLPEGNEYFSRASYQAMLQALDALAGAKGGLATLDPVTGKVLAEQLDVDTSGLATKSELKVHTDNAEIHVTQAKQNAWDAKETTTGSKAKADAAEANAKNYAVNAIQTGALTVDPNTTQDAYMVTNHANGPGSGVYWHIRTLFYGGNRTRDRAQYAITYNGVPRFMYRHLYNNVWSPWTEAGGGDLGKQIFTANGTFTAPKTGVYKVTVTGGGGSGGIYNNKASGGGGGGTAIKWVTLTKGQTVPVTVGKGGAIPTVVGNGNPGGASSFGSHCSATGGSSGYHSTYTDAAAGSRGGEGLKGDINSKGGNSLPADSTSQFYAFAYSMGGGSYWGDATSEYFISGGVVPRSYGAGSPGMSSIPSTNSQYDYTPGNGVVVVEWA